jgi:D-alanine transaminase
LYRSAALLSIEMPFAPEEMKSLLRQLILKLDGPNLLIYWQISRGTGRRRHNFPTDSSPNVWVMIEPARIKEPEAQYKLITTEDQRHLLCTIKTINLAANVLMGQKAAEAHCDEAVFYRNGLVTECSKSNLSILKDGVFQTAPTNFNILPGISRANLLKACQALGIVIQEQPFSLKEMMAADEIIVSSSGALCVSAYEIDRQAVGGKDPHTFSRLRDYVYDEFFQKTGADRQHYFSS